MAVPRPRLIDLSHEIEHGMVTYRGLPAPAISDWLSRDASTARYAPGTTFQIGKMELVANTGTYIDRARFEGQELKGKAVLVHSGWDRHWRTDTYSSGQHPFVTKDAAEYLATAGAALVGIDSFNIDDDKDGTRPAHTILLGAGIAIVEHMTRLSELPDRDFRFFAVPPRVKGMGSFPVRAFAIVS